MTSPHQLDDFLRNAIGFSWRASGNVGPHRKIALTSQIWKGAAWEHDLVLIHPSAPVADDIAVLYVTGGDVNFADIQEGVSIAETSGVAVAILFHIPVQPIEDMWEDDLIAHTFQRYIDTGDATWPLLFPMTTAAIRAMDALQEFTGGALRRFVITGASKRGWTSWMAAATGDERICGIAPMVFDNLNFPAQMRHQIELWGRYSEQIEDYTSRELQDQMASPRGAELTRMVDPFTYLTRITCPVLIINGANDAYWATDALSLYWNALPTSKRCLVVPNAGHILGDKIQMVETLSAFARARAAGELLPSVEWDGWGTTHSNVHATGASDIRFWLATSPSLDFRESLWSPLESGGDLPVHNAAVFVEARFNGSYGSYSLTTPASVRKA